MLNAEQLAKLRSMTSYQPVVCRLLKGYANMTFKTSQSRVVSLEQFRTLPWKPRRGSEANLKNNLEDRRLTNKTCSSHFRLC